MTKMDAPMLSVEEVRLYEWPYVLRLPFRFGAITVTHGRQIVVHLRIRLTDGREAWGVAAEALAAKWFDKSPELTDDQNLDQLRAAVELAVAAYLAGGRRNAFGHFASTYRDQLAEGARRRLPAIVASFGPAMLDRAVVDALGRALGMSFYDLARSNALGIEAGSLTPDLAGFDIARFLAALAPNETIEARHTVGMVDPIVAADQTPAERVNDGLPETLEEVVAAYGHRYFKLKVGGNVAADVARLSKIASVLDRAREPYFATLDGNEQFADAAGVLELWRAIEATPALARLRESVLFIEQPIKRAAALAADVRALAAKKKVIVDESDGELETFSQARALGYAGISSKNCKGLYKSILNAARCRNWGDCFMSAEDLTTLAGVSVQQDLALVNLIGLTHVERNGHHFVDGFAGRPAAEARGFLAAHPGLYRESHGRVRLAIAKGRLALGSLDCPGFAAGAELDVSAMEPMLKPSWPG